jgi:signal transduction histidine kinase
MAPPRAELEQLPVTTKSSSLSRWQHILYLLVAFALFAVALSLFLSHRYVQIYAWSVTDNQAWTERLHECSRHGQLAAAVNAPGNDVFQSHQGAVEEARMEAAVRLLTEHLDSFEEGLLTNAEAAEAGALLANLEAFRRRMQDMAGEARGLFAHLRSGRTQDAGQSMASMDRQYALGNQALEKLRGEIAAIQTRHFQRQTEVASSLLRFQYVMSGLLLLMIGGSLAYAHRVRRQVETATRENEALIAALRDSEATLDCRVRERTAELVLSEGRYRSLVDVRQQLLKKLISAQEDERRRIARDLHDEIGQSLTSLLIGLRTVGDSATPEEARARADDLRRTTVATIDEVRRLARGLRPSVLDDLGLTAALERYAADFSQAHAIEVDVRAADAGVRRLSDEIETALYRIAQEALTNTAKHADAKHVCITVDRRPDSVCLTVTDDGRGFASQPADTTGQLGLNGMQERAALLNGTVTVDSGPGRGTRVQVSIPCEEQSHGGD